MSISLDRLVPIAEVARPHGIRGELRLKVYNAETELLGAGRRVIVRKKGAKSAGDKTARILTSRAIPQGVLVTLEGVTDRNGADAIRGASLLVPRSELPVLGDGEFYAFDLEGARAELVSGELVGTVTGLATYPTCEVLMVRTPAGESLEFPLVDDIVAEVDSVAHVVRLKSTESL